MFHFGVTEVMVILVVALAFLGPNKLAQVTGGSRHRRTVSSDERSSWGWSDWILVSAVVILAATTGGLIFLQR